MVETPDRCLTYRATSQEGRPVTCCTEMMVRIHMKARTLTITAVQQEQNHAHGSGKRGVAEGRPMWLTTHLLLPRRCRP